MTFKIAKKAHEAWAKTADMLSTNVSGRGFAGIIGGVAFLGLVAMNYATNSTPNRPDAATLQRVQALDLSKR